MKRVSDIITASEIQTWNVGENIAISAGLGSGKSYMCKNTLYNVAKENGSKILMLIHRANCVSQFREEIEDAGKEDAIEIITYQSLEHDIIYKKGRIDLSQYRYIVSDEFHYFFNDSPFNNRTSVSFEAIIRQETATKIFMSATGEYMKRYMKQYIDEHNLDNLRMYNFPTDYSFISDLSFFNDNDSIIKILNDLIAKKEKVLVFIQSAELAYNLYRKFQSKCSVVFNCGESSQYYKKNVDKARIAEILKNQKFDEQMMITTACFDSGINLIDTELHNIVIDMTDICSLIQCIGRKRIQNEDDKISLYIKNINNQRLAGLRQKMKAQLEMADYFIENDYSVMKLIQKYPRVNDQTNIIYDDMVDGDQYIKKLNHLVYWKKKLDIELFSFLIKDESGNGYSNFLARKFGFYDVKSDTYLYKTISADDALEEYLKSIVGEVMLQKSDRKELIEKIDARSGGCRLNGIDSLNEALQKRGMHYQIVRFETSRIAEKVDKKTGKITKVKKNYKNAWRLIDTNDTEV